VNFAARTPRGRWRALSAVPSTEAPCEVLGNSEGRPSLGQPARSGGDGVTEGSEGERCET